MPADQSSYLTTASKKIVPASSATRIKASRTKNQSIHFLIVCLSTSAVSWFLYCLGFNIVIEIAAAALVTTLAGFTSDSKDSTTDKALDKKPPAKALIPTVEALTLSESWDLLWSDEFDCCEINKKKCEHIEDCWLNGNIEQQYYNRQNNHTF
ncbi:hypothetical protein [Psychromonas ossibalaenae]|uniref:hypothetical protein n=1 Tax=Psychromonas ossibalaenae TaxID=444922 RepID=UPI000375F8E0|nr:hypothetical protein [Psychromonas ossibalaenae]